jgi:hypothetical protein
MQRGCHTAHNSERGASGGPRSEISGVNMSECCCARAESNNRANHKRWLARGLPVECLRVRDDAPGCVGRTPMTTSACRTARGGTIRLQTRVTQQSQSAMTHRSPSVCACVCLMCVSRTVPGQRWDLRFNTSKLDAELSMQRHKLSPTTPQG